LATHGPDRKYWAEPTAENRDVIRKKRFDPDGTRWQYTPRRSPIPETVPPESYTLELGSACNARGISTFSSICFLDYASNVKLYPKFQEYLRKAKPPLLAIWGQETIPFSSPPERRRSAKTYTWRDSPVPDYRPLCNRKRTS